MLAEISPRVICFCVPIKYASSLHEKNNVVTSKNMQKYSKGKPEQLIFTDHNWKEKPE